MFKKILSNFSESKEPVKVELLGQPLTARQHYENGEQKRLAGQWAAATIDQKLALDVNPHFIPALLELSMLMRIQNDLPAAKLYAEKILKREPNMAYAWHEIGIIEFQEAHYEAAISALTKALELQPDILHSHYYLGWAYKSLSLLDKAKQCFMRCVELDPNFTDAQKELELLN